MSKAHKSKVQQRANGTKFRKATRKALKGLTSCEVVYNLMGHERRQTLSDMNVADYVCHLWRNGAKNLWFRPVSG